MEPAVVSDTSPIRALNNVGLLHILTTLFNPVVVPPAVRDELAKPGAHATIHIETMAGFVLQTPHDAQLVAELRAQHDLDAGESEAIALARELQLTILVDERAGRTTAQALGLKVTGTGGLLVLAKQNGLIPAVVPLLLTLRDHHGFRVGDAFLSDVRRLAGE